MSVMSTTVNSKSSRSAVWTDRVFMTTPENRRGCYRQVFV